MRSAVRLATERLDRECVGWRQLGEVVAGDAQELPWPESFFDAVLANECIYADSWETSRLIYADIGRVLKPGGKLYSKTFASGSAGDGTGVQVGRNAWLCTAGGLAGKGYSRFTAFEEIPELVGGLKVIQTELQRLTRDNGTCEVREWIIYAEKPDGWAKE